MRWALTAPRPRTRFDPTAPLLTANRGTWAFSVAMFFRASLLRLTAAWEILWLILSCCGLTITLRPLVASLVAACTPATVPSPMTTPAVTPIHQRPFMCPPILWVL